MTLSFCFFMSMLCVFVIGFPCDISMCSKCACVCVHVSLCVSVLQERKADKKRKIKDEEGQSKDQGEIKGDSAE